MDEEITMIITIDGPIGTGKSTIAKELAQRIRFIYFDTGAMYRSLTYALLKNNISPKDIPAIIEYLSSFDFDINIKGGEKRYLIDREDVTDAIRGEKVTSIVSEVAAIPEIREKLVDIQRKLAEGLNVIFEGRDMGTVVFPNAEVKIYLEGDPVVRAKRRYEEQKTKYPEEYKNLTLKQAIEDINKRDHFDMTREVSPLYKAADAHAIDTTSLTLDEVITKIMEFINIT